MGKKTNNASPVINFAEGGIWANPREVASRRKRRNFDLNQLLVTDGRGRKIMQFRRRQVIFSQGDACDHVFYIEQGSAKLALTSKSGKEGIVGLLGPGDFFGEIGLAGREQYISTASAATDCRLVRIENEWMNQQLNRNRAFSDFFMAYLLARKMRIEADLVDQLFNFTEKRLARALLVMAGFGNHPEPGDEKLPKTSQETLAAMVGTTRSHVSHFMNKFRKMGYIRYNGGIEVRRTLLNVLLGD